MSDEGFVVGVQIGCLLGAGFGQLVLAERSVRPGLVDEGLEAGRVDPEGGFAVGQHALVTAQVQLRQRPVGEQHATVPHLLDGLSKIFYKIQFNLNFCIHFVVELQRLGVVTRPKGNVGFFLVNVRAQFAVSSLSAANFGILAYSFNEFL